MYLVSVVITYSTDDVYLVGLQFCEFLFGVGGEVHHSAFVDWIRRAYSMIRFGFRRPGVILSTLSGLRHDFLRGILPESLVTFFPPLRFRPSLVTRVAHTL